MSDVNKSGQASRNAYYTGTVETFCATSPDEVIGVLAKRAEFDLQLPQRDAWLEEIRILRTALAGLTGTLFMEFSVPRIGSRLDAVLISRDSIFAIEFKVGEKRFLRDHLNQVWDYALDLKNFHKASHNAHIIPILVATDAEHSGPQTLVPYADLVYEPVRSNVEMLREIVDSRLKDSGPADIDADYWAASRYEPTPTIIQAAQALYSQHSVEAIARHDAGENLAVTARRIETLIEDARQSSKKVIIFVTGVPGAGKTLVGLDVATRKRANNPSHAVFLSGNGPLVDVLREALARDEIARLKQQSARGRRGDTRQRVKAFIQNVHHFRDAGLGTDAPPTDHVVIFDEAQRAWNARKTSNFMARRKGQVGFTQSEPEFLISCMDRHEEWALVVCLVGGGQEINDGEAGISAWLEALEKYPQWQVYLSPELADSEYSALGALQRLEKHGKVNRDPAFHLNVSMRSFRAETVSRFVKCLLDCDEIEAKTLQRELHARYPIVLTRELALAKRWIRSKARGTERFGMVASSNAQRLRPHAIDVRVKIDPVHWFLNDSADVRSSWYMEDAATEFQVQGLELDWICVTWDADLRYASSGWQFNSFKGSRWLRINAEDRKQYLINAYRVLLTRARQGMVIFVPHGDGNDHTRKPAFYDSTFEYLRSLGLPELTAQL